MKTRFIYYIIFILLLLFLTIKYFVFFKYSSEIESKSTYPKIGWEDLIHIKKERITYSKSFFYKGDYIGFTALVDKKNYITVTKLGKVNKSFFNIIRNSSKPSNNSVIGLPPSDINDIMSRYVELSSFPYQIKDIYYYNEGNQLKSYNDNFKELVFDESNTNLAFNNKEPNKKDFGYVGPKQITSISFINYFNDLYIISNYSLEKRFESLHTLIEIDSM